MKEVSLKSNNKLKLFLFIYILVFSLCVLFLHGSYIDESLTFSLLPACLSLIFLAKSGTSTFMADKYVSISSFILSGLFLIMLSITNIYGECFTPLATQLELQGLLNVQVNAILLTLLFSIGVLFSVFIVLVNCFDLFLKVHKSENQLSHSIFINLGKIKINKYIIPIAIFAFVFAVGGLYGYNISDTDGIITATRTGFWSDWHVVNYSFYVKILTSLLPEKYYGTGVILAQCIFWIIISNYALNSIWKNTKNTKACFFYMMLGCIIITPLFYITVVVKDTIFSMCLFSFSISIYNFVCAKKPGKKEIFLLILNGTFAALFRHFAVWVVFVSIVALAIYSAITYKKAKKIAVSILALSLIPIIAFYGLDVGVGIKLLKAESNPKYITYTLPIYLTVAVTDRVGEENIDSFTKETLETVAPISEWCSYYEQNKYLADMVTRPSGPLGEKVDKYFTDEFCEKMLKCNFTLIAEHPKEYLSSLFDITSIVWEIGRPNDEPQYDINDTSARDYIQNNSAANITWTIYSSLRNNNITHPFLFRGGIWIFAALFSSLVLIKKKRAELLFVILPIVIYAASLFLSIPTSDLRYVLSFLEIGSFYLVVAKSANLKKQSTSVTAIQ